MTTTKRTGYPIIDDILESIAPPPSTEQPRPEQVGGECAEDCHFGDHDDYDIEQERIKFQKELGAAMVKAGAREVELDGPAAPERGERYGFVVFTGRYKILDYHKPDGQQMATADGEDEARIIVRALNATEQHSTLIAQRERLLRVLQEILTEAEYVGDAKVPFTTWIAEKIRPVLTTIEQEGTRQR